LKLIDDDFTMDFTTIGSFPEATLLLVSARNSKIYTFWYELNLGLVDSSDAV
jgi:hypothetical protein